MVIKIKTAMESVVPWELEVDNLTQSGQEAKGRVPGGGGA